MIDMLVVAAMIGRPVEAGVFKGAGAEKQGEEFHRSLCFEGKVGKKAVVTDCDAHHRRTEIEEEHAELKPIDSVMIQIDGGADERDEGCADEETGRDPVHTVKGNAEHNFFKSTVTRGGLF